jgi:hypothetical protein
MGKQPLPKRPSQARAIQGAAESMRQNGFGIGARDRHR